MGVFRTYDVRGKYPEEVNEELAYNIGRAMVIMLKAEGKKFLVCKDARMGSEELSQAVLKGVTDQGANATYIGLATTPLFYYFKYVKKFDAGIMITASHLPSGFNGLKAMREERVFMGYDMGYKEVEEMINSGKLENTPLAEEKGTIKNDNYEEEYIEFVTSNTIGDLTGMKVVADGSNGMAGPVAEKIFKKLGVNYVGLSMDYNLDNPDHGLNPLKSEAQQALKDKVIAEGAAFGAVFDADADRIIFVDEKGQDLQGDYSLALLAKFLAKSGDYISHDLLCGRAFRELVDKMGCVRVMTKVGHVFVKQGMVENNARIGSEVSGHLYLQEANGAESTILGFLHMIALLKKEQKPLSELVQVLKDAWIKSGEVNFEVDSNETKDKKIEEISEAFSDGKQARLDGVTMEYEDYWLNVRKSNTEPVLRLRVEARTQELMDKIMSKVSKIVGATIEAQ